MKGSDGERLMAKEYVSFMSSLRLPEVPVRISPNTGELDVETHGKWPEVSLWETVIMSELAQLYGEKMMEQLGISQMELSNEADQKLTEKIDFIKQYPGVKFADFGTRRRFSYGWHEHAVDRLATELPEQFIGTSNPYLACKFGLKAIGTYAHELPMVFAAIEHGNGNNPLEGVGIQLDRWEQFQRGTLLTGLPDTFGSDSFFKSMTSEQAHKWDGYRQDSGDPIEFANKTIAFLKENDVDPMSKFILPSDGLTFPKMAEIHQQLDGKINHFFGIGGNITNDVHNRYKSLNIVVKATRVNEINTVKLSDNEGKHTGPKQIVEYYKSVASQRIGARATRQTVTI